MGIKLNQFYISLDKTSVYRPGDVVTGYCVIQLEGEMNLSQLEILLEGMARCQWDESYTTSTTNSEGQSESTTETRTISSHQVLIDLRYKPGTVYPTILTAGEHRFEFTFNLPTNNLIQQLPSSFKGHYGNIKYLLKGRIHTPALTFDKRCEVELTLHSPPLYPIEHLLKSITNSAHKTIGILSKKSISLFCNLKRTGYNLGTTIEVECNVNSETKRTLELRASLKNRVTYLAEGSKQFTRDKIVIVNGNPIQPKAQQKEVISLFVPDNITVTQTSCSIIKFEYIIVVTLVIPGSFDLHCELPVIITNELLPIK